MNTPKWMLLTVAILTMASHAFGEPMTRRLLPFQGRLADSSGVAMTNGLRVIRFKLFNDPVQGETRWAGEIHRTSVNNGLINVILGTKAALSEVDFGESLYLELTVDVSGPDGVPDGLITSADSPLTPRQALLPAFFAAEAAFAREAYTSERARDSVKLGGFDWTDMFGEGVTNPANALVSGERIKAHSVTSLQLGTNAVGSAQIVDHSVTFDKRSPREVGTSVGRGGFAISPVVDLFATSSTTLVDVPGLEVNLETSGGPVMIFLAPGPGPETSYVEAYGKNFVSAGGRVSLWRDGSLIYDSAFQLDSYGSPDNRGLLLPSSSFQFVDLPPRGVHRYSVKIRMDTANRDIRITNTKLVAYEP